MYCHHKVQTLRNTERKTRHLEINTVVKMLNTITYYYYYYPVTFSILLACLLGLLVLFPMFRASKKTIKHKMRHKNEDCTTVLDDDEFRSDVIIVGAGVAGASLGYSLAMDGRRVRVIERDLTEPHRICGELLHPGGYLNLIELGLQDCVVAVDAQKVVGYQFYKDGKTMTLKYPLEKFSSDVAARSFYNGRFVQRLRDKAASLPNLKLEQGSVSSLIEENGVIKGVSYKTATGEELKAYAPLTVICDGCASNLRRSVCSPPVVEVSSHFVGVVLKNCKLTHPNHGHIILADPSMVLLYPVSSVEIRCLVDVPVGPGKKLPSVVNGDMATYLKSVVSPQIPAELYESFVAAVDEGNIKTLPNRSMPAATTQSTPGALLIGDAFNMRHPFTGAGMTIALTDVVILRDLLRPLKDLNDSAKLNECLESFYTLRKPTASILNIFAGLFYKVFCASPDEAHTEIRSALFDYLSLGGECMNGPVALLGGIERRPLRLAAHLVGVAIYAFGRLLFPFPSPKRLWLGLRVLTGASGIIFPLLKTEGIAQTFLPATFATSK